MANDLINTARAGNLLEPSAPSITHVLAVDDDEYARLLLQRYLVKRGYDVTLVSSVAEAKKILQTSDVNYFGCVVTDYMMPEENGASLIYWMKENLPTLTAIVVTAVGEKGIVAQPLRSGACNFLDKPVRANDLISAVEDAVAQTLKRRELAKTEADAREVGRIQKRLLRKQGSAALAGVKIAHYALRGAGGDFSVCRVLADGRILVLAADVSGHDLRSAFISAYFQGVLRGMLENNVPLDRILGYFNQFLVQEWADAEEAFSSDTTSLAVCVAMIDTKNNGVEILSHGFPSGVIIGADGIKCRVIEGGGYPLGWIHPVEINHHQIAVEPGGSLMLWTDGVEEQAERMGVTLWSLLTALLRHDEERGRPDYLNAANDDVMVMQVPTGEGMIDEAEQIIMNEAYPGSRYTEIDVMQKCWGRSLRLVYPEAKEERLEEVAICLREVVLNGMLHGCKKADDQVCRLLVSDLPGKNTVRVRFDDPGEGHDFDIEAHARKMEETLIDQHRGLMFLNFLSNRMVTQRRGASIEMDFILTLSEPLS